MSEPTVDELADIVMAILTRLEALEERAGVGTLEDQHRVFAARLREEKRD